MISWVKKTIVLVICVCFMVSVCGCRDYVGLDEISIVVGLAIDKSDKPGRLHLSFEIIDTLESSKDRGKVSTLIESEGNSVYEAISNANLQLARDLYFGNTDILVIHEAVARESGLNSIFENILRDYIFRDTIKVVVSKGETARDIIKPNKDSNVINSYEVTNKLDEMVIKSHTMHNIEIYHIYDYLKNAKGNIVLPVYAMKNEDSKVHPHMDGAAVFLGDRFFKYIDDEDLLYYSYISENFMGGAFVHFSDGDRDKCVTQNIIKTSSDKKFSYREDKLTIKVDISVVTGISSIYDGFGEFNSSKISVIEKEAQAALKDKLDSLIGRMQEEGLDVFDFADELYRHDNYIWEQVKDNWQAVFAEAEILVNPMFEIQNAGMLRKY